MSPDDAGGSVAILARRGGLVIVAKPAGLATLPAKRGPERTLAAVAAALLGVRATDIHVVTRLDAPVSGAVLLAVDAEARRIAVVAHEAHALHRGYAAIAAHRPEPSEGEWSAPIGRGMRPGTWQAGGKDARPASTQYRVVATTRAAAPGGAPLEPTLLALQPRTGRTHQLRIHAATAGAPLLGDAAHDGPRRVVTGNGSVIECPRVALHALRLELTLDDATLGAEAPVPADMQGIWAALGGAPEAWRAV